MKWQDVPGFSGTEEEGQAGPWGRPAPPRETPVPNSLFPYACCVEVGWLCVPLPVEEMGISRLSCGVTWQFHLTLLEGLRVQGAPSFLSPQDVNCELWISIWILKEV